MKNGIPASALSEFVNEVKQEPDQAKISYGTTLAWETGARSTATAKTMKLGGHRVARSFSWKVDEPRQLLGANHGPNPQELLFSAVGSCLMVAFVMGATARGVVLDRLDISIAGDLDLQGFMGLANGDTHGFQQLEYDIQVASDAPEDVLRELHESAIAHSPNAQTLLHGVQLSGGISISPVS